MPTKATTPSKAIVGSGDEGDDSNILIMITVLFYSAFLRKTRSTALNKYKYKMLNTCVMNTRPKNKTYVHITLLKSLKRYTSFC